ncbi:coiled-coil domain-containing protein 152-like isoform X2 [Ptychodera flava]|uniref:coiled-coil domain-containing protein 152-like isoform X2 n=1 Tax=Ptychodera flava TaxID=63121 RepID=UPI00396A5503
MMDSRFILTACFKTLQFGNRSATTDLSCENSNLELQLRVLKKQLQSSQTNEKMFIQDVERLQAMVNQLQSTLSKRCHIEEQNVELKDKLARQEEEIGKIKQELDTSLREAAERIQRVKEENKEDLENIQKATREKAEQDIAALMEKLKAKDQDMKGLNEELSNLKKDKHTEIVKLRLQYDAKLLSLQKQNQKTAQQKGQTGTANQEIFRKKWQHMKAESEREILSLKKTISELQKKLDMQAPPYKRKKF